MTGRRRVLQWATFSRTWWLFDANHQCPFQSAPKLCLYLQGKHKPIYHPLSDVGDHVVVINTQRISMPDRLWRTWRYFHHTGHAGGFSSQRAWQVHRNDPTKVLEKQIYATLPGNLLRKGLMARLHLFPHEEVPDEILRNVSNQIRQVMPVPKQVEDFTDEEQMQFPQLFKWPENLEKREGKVYEKQKPYLTEDQTVTSIK